MSTSKLTHLKSFSFSTNKWKLHYLLKHCLSPIGFSSARLDTYAGKSHTMSHVSKPLSLPYGNYPCKRTRLFFFPIFHLLCSDLHFSLQILPLAESPKVLKTSIFIFNYYLISKNSTYFFLKCIYSVLVVSFILIHIL